MNKKKPRIGSHPDQKNLFLVTDSSTYSYQNLLRFAQHFKTTLPKKARSAGAAIGLHAQSSDELIFIIAACWLQQIPFVNFNPNNKINSLQPELKHLELSVIITDRPESCDHPDLLPISTFDLTKKMVKEEVNHTSSENISLLSSPDKQFGYFFTSGTSGPPKTVPLKRQQMLAAAKSSAGNIYPGPNECWLLCLPLHHIGGISVILRSLLYGSAIFRMDHFNAQQVCHLLSSNKKVVATSLVPTMLKRMLNYNKGKVHSNFQAILLGGGPVTPSLLQSCGAQAIPLITSYGMTETCAQIAANPIQWNDNTPVLESVGRIFKPNEIEIRDKSGQPVNTGTSGSIWLKGPQIFDGYLDSDHTNFDKKNWFNTGDFGRLDSNNYLYIEARRTDLIITGGENVSPFEVEAALQRINGIAQAAVFGIPDNEWGQKVVAAVIMKKDVVLAEDEIIQKLNRNMLPYKVPKRLVMVDTFPRTETGKIKRSELAQLIRKSR